MVQMRAVFILLTFLIVMATVTTVTGDDPPAGPPDPGLGLDRRCEYMVSRKSLDK